jgi:hypothetical protein
MFRFPTGEQTSQAICALGIVSPTLKEAILSKPSNYKIAPWHYHQDHLERDAKGMYSFKKLPVYKDKEGKSWSFPPPNASLDLFIENIPSNQYCRGGTTTTYLNGSRNYNHCKKRRQQLIRALNNPSAQQTPPLQPQEEEDHLQLLSIVFSLLLEPTRQLTLLHVLGVHALHQKPFKSTHRTMKSGTSGHKSTNSYSKSTV